MSRRGGLGFGEIVSGIGAAALLGAMFLPWFGGELSAQVLGTQASIAGSVAELSAWQVFETVDLVLAAVAVGALVLAALEVFGAGVSRNAWAVLAVLAFAALLVLSYRMVVLPLPKAVDASANFDVVRRVGAWIGLGAAMVLAFGTWTTAADR